LKYCILIIFEKSYYNFSLSYWLITVSPYKIYHETGHLIENFVNDGIHRRTGRHFTEGGGKNLP